MWIWWGNGGTVGGRVCELPSTLWRFAQLRPLNRDCVALTPNQPKIDYSKAALVYILLGIWSVFASGKGRVNHHA